MDISDSVDSRPALSIIICTYNRADELEQLLTQLFGQFREIAIYTKNPVDFVADVELVLVDNNSEDRTKDMVFDIIVQKKNYNLEIKYILEVNQGSSAARNRGIKEASGNLLAFLDDDVLLTRDWLKQVYRIADDRPEHFVCGARVMPDWSGELPDWLNVDPPFEIIQSCFPSHDYGVEEKLYPFEINPDESGILVTVDENQSLKDHVDYEEDEGFMEGLKNVYKELFIRRIQNPISACFLATRDIFRRYGDFRLDLGIQAGRRGACEDTEFFWRLLAAGVEVKYMPKVGVHHPIPEARMTQKFVLDWYRLLGRTLQYMQQNELTYLDNGNKAPGKLKLRLKLISNWLLYLSSHMLLDPVRTFWFKAQVEKTKGALSLGKTL